ncbi:hypothetical protein SAMN05192533_10192 [Mesobacillus persicus]|uniref:Uncharacterized protein n=1 Tax=Mesobacillus persicus TaxID=930146 RepID=A0A1H7VSF6_9BACI|nr:hypothetical protein SAMN05192533_10192 [Mesobacillus persicus]
MYQHYLGTVFFDYVKKFCGSGASQYEAEQNEELIGFATLYSTFNTLKVKKGGKRSEWLVYEIR